MAACGLAADVASLEWLAGCWVGQLGPVTVEEQWNRPVGGQMMGLARTVKQGRVVFSEFMRIEREGDGAVFTPRVGTKEKPVAFRSVRLADGEVVFENPAHDFPQRIIYRRVSGGVFARIEGMDKGKARGEDFPMKETSCR